MVGGNVFLALAFLATAAAVRQAADKECSAAANQTAANASADDAGINQAAVNHGCTNPYRRDPTSAVGNQQVPTNNFKVADWGSMYTLQGNFPQEYGERRTHAERDFEVWRRPKTCDTMCLGRNAGYGPINELNPSLYKSQMELYTKHTNERDAITGLKACTLTQLEIDNSVDGECRRCTEGFWDGDRRSLETHLRRWGALGPGKDGGAVDWAIEEEWTDRENGKRLIECKRTGRLGYAACDRQDCEPQCIKEGSRCCRSDGPEGHVWVRPDHLRHGGFMWQTAVCPKKSEKRGVFHEWHPEENWLMCDQIDGYAPGLPWPRVAGFQWIIPGLPELEPMTP